MDCSLAGFSIHWIFQARILEWVAISFSRGSSRRRDWIGVSRVIGRLLNVWATRDVSQGNPALQLCSPASPRRRELAFHWISAGTEPALYWFRRGAGGRRVLTSRPSPKCLLRAVEGEVREEEDNPELPLRSWAIPFSELGSPPTNQESSAQSSPARTRGSGDLGPVRSRDWARPPVVAMAAASSSVVRRVEELGDLAQAHIQQLSEAAGEDGEGAEEREAVRRAVVRSWLSTAIGAEAAACSLWIPGQKYRRCCASGPSWAFSCLPPGAHIALRQRRLLPDQVFHNPRKPLKSQANQGFLSLPVSVGGDWQKGEIWMKVHREV